MQIPGTYDEMAAEREKIRRQIAADAPEPTVINVDALVQFHAPRTFDWGGVGLRAPPLSFVAGVRLLVAANALRDLRQAKAPAPFQQAAVQTAALLLRQSVQPVTRLRRLGWRLSSCFTHDEPELIEGLLRWLLHVPDDSPVIPPTGKVTLDFMDSFVGFVREFPQWVGPDGMPISWAAYVYGSRHMGRVHARDILRNAMAVRAGGADQKDYKSFNVELSEQAGWHHG